MNSSLADEIDFVNIIDSIRQLKAHLKLQYDEHQRSLLAFDKLYFIEPEYHERSQASLVDRIKRQISNKGDSDYPCRYILESLHNKYLYTAPSGLELFA